MATTPPSELCSENNDDHFLSIFATGGYSNLQCKTANILQGIDAQDLQVLKTIVQFEEKQVCETLKETLSILIPFENKLSATSISLLPCKFPKIPLAKVHLSLSVV